MSDDVQQQLIDDHFLFKEGDRFLQVPGTFSTPRTMWASTWVQSIFAAIFYCHTAPQAANASRYWPTGRGIFHNEEKTFLVWVGEEDHLRIISMAPGGDVGRVFQLLIDGIEHMDSLMSFTSDERLGWLTFCPTNLGTAIRASVHIKLPLLARGGMEALQEVADKWQLQVSSIWWQYSKVLHWWKLQMRQIVNVILNTTDGRCEGQLESIQRQREGSTTFPTGVKMEIPK